LNNPCVSIFFDNRKNISSDIFNAKTVSAEAEAKDVKKDKEKLRELLIDRHPELKGFLNEPDYDLFRLEVKKYYYVDNFDNKQILTMN